uniref:C2 domain-containing protein n=1 Tax=Timema poppense TaxID=170557 RepID=A0A7R9HE36_TIMPO|nr:unnamed protein product [Timema poppensis]
MNLGTCRIPPPKWMVGLSDPFCTLYLSSANTHRYNTSVKSATLCPVWEEHFSLHVSPDCPSLPSLSLFLLYECLVPSITTKSESQGYPFHTTLLRNLSNEVTQLSPSFHTLLLRNLSNELLLNTSIATVKDTAARKNRPPSEKTTVKNQDPGINTNTLLYQTRVFHLGTKSLHDYGSLLQMPSHSRDFPGPPLLPCWIHQKMSSTLKQEGALKPEGPCAWHIRYSGRDSLVFLNKPWSTNTRDIWIPLHPLQCSPFQPTTLWSFQSSPFQPTISLVIPVLILPANNSLVIPVLILPANNSVVIPVLILPANNSLVITLLILPANNSMVIPVLILPANNSLVITLLILPANNSVVIPVLILPANNSLVIPVLTPSSQQLSGHSSPHPSSQQLSGHSSPHPSSQQLFGHSSHT